MTHNADKSHESGSIAAGGGRGEQQDAAIGGAKLYHSHIALCSEVEHKLLVSLSVRAFTCGGSTEKDHGESVCALVCVQISRCHLSHVCDFAI